jgi:hypothetical protein
MLTLDHLATNKVMLPTKLNLAFQQYASWFFIKQINSKIAMLIEASTLMLPV